MKLIREYTNLYLSLFNRLRKDFLNEMVRFKNDNLDYHSSFINLCKTLSIENGISPLPLKYYDYLWNKLYVIYDLTLLDKRYDSFLKAKSFKDIPKDFPLQKYKKNKEDIKSALEDYDKCVEDLAFLSYCLDYPLEVNQEEMEYLILFCHYDGSFGATRLKMLYKIVMCRSNDAKIEKKI